MYTQIWGHKQKLQHAYATTLDACVLHIVPCCLVYDCYVRCRLLPRTHKLWRVAHTLSRQISARRIVWYVVAAAPCLLSKIKLLCHSLWTQNQQTRLWEQNKKTESGSARSTARWTVWRLNTDKTLTCTSHTLGRDKWYYIWLGHFKYLLNTYSYYFSGFKQWKYYRCNVLCEQFNILWIMFICFVTRLRSLLPYRCLVCIELLPEA